MEWLAFALLGPLFWTISNFLDKYALEKLTRGVGEYAFLGILGPIAILIITPLLFPIHLASPTVIAVTAFGGFLLNYCYMVYGFTLTKTDTSRVIPIFQLRSPIVLIAGMVLFNEFLNAQQILSFFIIFAGAVLLSLDIATLRRPRLSRWSFPALLATAGFAGVLLINNFSVANLDVPSVLVYFDIGFLLAALSYLLYRPWRREILEGLRTMTWKKLGLFAANDLADEAGQLCSKIALTTAPAAALVAAIQGIQSFYAILIGLFLTLWFPRLVKEDIRVRALAQKVLGAAIVFSGVALLSFAA